MKNFIAHTDKIRKEMLESINYSSIEDLYKHVPIQTDKFNLSEPISELDVQRIIRAIAQKNNSEYISFVGGGVYNKFIPAAINYLAQRFEFLTAYTPYQPEISQGTLQIIYEYQTMIARLTGMDIANASLYDAGSACAEAVLMAHRISKGAKNKALISNKINPEYKEVIKTYAWAQGIELIFSDEIPSDLSEYFCVLVQYPNYYGEIEIVHQLDVIQIVCANLSALSILKPPVHADIVVGDVQPLGISQNFGGPHAGSMACKENFMRQMPGRLVGRTVDAEGEQAFTLTIQTREQHIKREKATSNICSNQSLIALSAAIYLSLLGEKGFKQAGVISANLAHELSEQLNMKGIKTLNKHFFNEFVIQVEDSDTFLEKLKANNILGGIKVDKHKIIVCATEMNTKEDIIKYVNTI